MANAGCFRHQVSRVTRDGERHWGLSIRKMTRQTRAPYTLHVKLTFSSVYTVFDPIITFTRRCSLMGGVGSRRIILTFSCDENDVVRLQSAIEYVVQIFVTGQFFGVIAFLKWSSTRHRQRSRRRAAEC